LLYIFLICRERERERKRKREKEKERKRNKEKDIERFEMSLGATKREKRKKEWRERREIVKAKKMREKKRTTWQVGVLVASSCWLVFKVYYFTNYYSRSARTQYVCAYIPCAASSIIHS